MQLKTAEQLTAEYREIVGSQGPLATARARGTLEFYDLKARVEGVSEDSAIHWILQAQIGTLDKLDVFLPADREPSSIELLAATRNLFENLVWLELFLLDPSWGLFFYGQLLKNEQEDLTKMIAKFEAEARLFEALDEEDSKILHDVYDGIGDLDDPTGEDMTRRRKEHDRRKEDLDRRARRSFALYAAAATFNGYSYQAYLLHNKEIPRYREQLQKIEQRIDAFRTEIADEAAFKKYLGAWKWRQAAQLVDMDDQYLFLYSLTSRLLHATPMNVVTEKELLEGERITLLEYIAVTVHDVLEAIERFDFPGKIDAIYVEVG